MRKCPPLIPLLRSPRRRQIRVNGNVKSTKNRQNRPSCSCFLLLVEEKIIRLHLPISSILTKLRIEVIFPIREIVSSWITYERVGAIAKSSRWCGTWMVNSVNRLGSPWVRLLSEIGPVEFWNAVVVVDASAAIRAAMLRAILNSISRQTQSSTLGSNVAEYFFPIFFSFSSSHR